jgi:TolA-binding protein
VAEPARAGALLEAYLKQAPATDPLRPDVLLRLGRARESLGQPAAAREQYEKVRRDYPKSAQAKDAKRLLESLKAKGPLE